MLNGQNTYAQQQQQQQQGGFPLNMPPGAGGAYGGGGGGFRAQSLSGSPARGGGGGGFPPMSPGGAGGMGMGVGPGGPFGGGGGGGLNLGGASPARGSLEVARRAAARCSAAAAAEVRLLSIRPRSRGARRSLRTFPVVTLHPRFPFNV